jgi:hypothetical protein
MFTQQRLTFVAALLLAGLWAGAAPLSAGQALTDDGLVSYYPVSRASGPIAIDGQLDEFSWQSAEQVDSFERILNDYDRVLHPTRAKMLWDDENFYFAFACKDPDIWAIYTEEDDPMWSEEVVEVFIDPDGDAENYLELEVNPLNAVVDLLIYALKPDWHSSKDWDIADLQTAVQVQGTVNDSISQDIGWTVEIAIPWAAMVDSVGGGGKPEIGDTWRLNLYRIERTAGRNARSRIVELEKELAPLQKKFMEFQEKTGAASEEELSDKQRKTLKKLMDKMQKKREEIGLTALQEYYHKQTEYTTFSETYQRGFHHPPRFGVVQFVE